MNSISRDVHTAAGTVRGFSDGTISRFRSIPYAKAPVGELRFRAPQPAVPWEGVRDCRKWGAAAEQKRLFTFTGLRGFQRVAEDCLTLNIVAPDDPGEGVLPVMVFFHGGAFFMGTSGTWLYDGANLARRGCIYVSVNYRLGALGALDLSSLSTDDITIENNLYLRDLVTALWWVQNNIAAFGGNPSNVTIFGESAGAHCVHTLLAVPSARGLFHRAIIQSTCNGLISAADASAENADMFLRELGVRKPDAASEVLSANPKVLINAQYRLMRKLCSQPGGYYGLGPTVDGEFLPQDPTDAIKSVNAHRVPLMIGYNGEEATTFQLLQPFIRLVDVSKEGVDRTLSLAGEDFANEVRALYPEYHEKPSLTRLTTDGWVASITWSIANGHSTHSPTYFYRYDYSTRALRRYRLGAGHGMELISVFGQYNSPGSQLVAGRHCRATAQAVSEDIQDRWVQFARSGIPGSDWPTYSAPSFQLKVFDQYARTESDTDNPRKTLWMRAPCTLYRKDPPPAAQQR